MRVRRSVGEDLAQGGGEGVRLAHAAVFAAEESVVAAGKVTGSVPSSSATATAARPAMGR
jgi:hypothetical protein